MRGRIRNNRIPIELCSTIHVDGDQRDLGYCRRL